MLESKPKEMQTRNVDRSAPHMTRIALVIEDREVDPSIVGCEPGAPHNDARFEDLFTAHRKAAALCFDPRDADDSRVGELAFRDADQCIATSLRLRAQPTTK